MTARGVWSLSSNEPPAVGPRKESDSREIEEIRHPTRDEGVHGYTGRNKMPIVVCIWILPDIPGIRIEYEASEDMY